MSHTLKDAGFRFICRRVFGCRPDYKWVHPASLRPGDVDCTDMGDEEFARFVQAGGVPA